MLIFSQFKCLTFSSGALCEFCQQTLPPEFFNKVETFWQQCNDVIRTFVTMTTMRLAKQQGVWWHIVLTNLFSFFGGFLPIFKGRCAHLSVSLEDLFKTREMNGIDIIFHHKFHQHHCVASFSGEKWALPLQEPILTHKINFYLNLSSYGAPKQS